MYSMARKLIPSFVKESALYQAMKRKAPHDAIYSEEYYTRDVETPAVESAPAMAASIIARFHPSTVMDVGCGTGALLAEFRARGCTVRGLEYAEAGLRRCRARGLQVDKFDIENQDRSSNDRYDLAISVEVAEHLPPETAGRYVSLLCQLAPLVICSAAAPGQGGTDHVNLQPKSYWIEKFNNHHYAYDQDSAELLSKQWRESGVASFYYDNLMVFRT